MWMMPCCLGELMPLNFGFLWNGRSFFLKDFFSIFRKIWKIMPLKSTIFLSGRKYIYHGTHLVVIFFVFVVIMNSTLIQSKEKNSGKKFITIIYRVMIWSREKKKGQKFFFVSLHYAFGWKYICHYSKHIGSIDWRKNVARAWFFLFRILKYFSGPIGNFFFGTNFFYLCWSKLLKEFFLLWSIVVVSWYQALSTLKNQTKLRVDIDWGYWKTKIIKEGCCWLLLFGKLSQTQQIKRPNKHYVACVCPCTRGSLWWSWASSIQKFCLAQCVLCWWFGESLDDINP